MRMKQKVSISSLPIHWGILILLIFIPQLLSAQENNDSIRIARDSVSMEPESVLQRSTLEIFPEKSTTYSLYPAGIGRFNNASLGYQHIFNEQFELQVRANAMKINMSHITGQAFSTSGAFLYHPSDRVTFKVFGSYDIGNSYGMSTHSYGATMSVDMSDRFGMEMGVQRYYDAMSGRWETVPVMIPYYHFNKFTLGLDVGGILYEILRDVVFDKNRGIGGPTIGPPRMHIPIR